jgi:hypothetical protein
MRTDARIAALAADSGFKPASIVQARAGILWAMRSGAPRSPTQAGRAAGTLAAAMAATLNATHGVDASPLFVVTWYALVVALVASVGAIIGARVFKW